ncbi:recombinase RecT [Eubacterium limosum]|uniref:Recombinase RecT n=1 Tax=Eubacterium limosum TaxID=1736 RepID=A0ABT5UWJ8_EUBLI|nr:recombinase RecT [Eubacterium limosum]MCB6569531.1 recombinase RecT [Eubacterium limosum]MDE1472734.1 recombinase RecT [Eubacterium limosum]
MTGKIQAATTKIPASGTEKGMTMTEYVKAMQPAIKKALPRVMTPERFSRITMTALSNNPKLQETTPQSFMGAMMTAAQLGLEPNTPLGQAYLIPFKNKGKLECQFQLGYKGLIDLAYRSGEVISIQAHTVYEKDEFDFEFGLEPKLKHIPTKETSKGDPVWFYAVFNTKDGGYGFEVMSVEDIRAHAAKYSQSYSSSYSPWKTNFEEMAKKTVLKKVLKYAPLKTDFVREISQDESVHTELSEDMTNLPNEYIEPEYEVDQEGTADEPSEAEKAAILESERLEAGNED